MYICENTMVIRFLDIKGDCQSTTTTPTPKRSREKPKPQKKEYNRKTEPAPTRNYNINPQIHRTAKCVGDDWIQDHIELDRNVVKLSQRRDRW